ncbi:thiamine diphosphokinase [Scopulibacillus darangshiensis]|uniref:Thiamine diphosphokinase n=1 Tax=Scopulibacillus darangshiensis TaxID=442528 RepID=A0A4V2SMY7_9BACL|nr:thiamine diphosphokinase [Scopulibacillus darangshiensis]TCP29136.1 thiamine diphosphokinase [Scopulibacillus darangshiensis]
MKYMAILAGGPSDLLPSLGASDLKDCSWIGVDRGTYILFQKGIHPIKAFGDFDSITADEMARIQNQDIDLLMYPSEKDMTDLELAVDWVIQKEPKRCYILGATGGRLDHTLINIQLLHKGHHSKTEFILMDSKNMVTLLKPGTYHVSRRHDFPYLSFVAFSESVSGLTLEGVKYPLTKAELMIGSSLCISNELIDSCAKVTFDYGLLLSVRSTD